MNNEVKNIPECVEARVHMAEYTTLGVGGFADFFAEVSDIETLHEVISWATSEQLPITILGGGSNVLVSDAGVRGVVVRPCFMDVVYRDGGETVVAKVGAGVSLDTFVADAVSKNLWGIENLSAIPGSVGATPVQNVGAYGVEVKDVITSVHVYDIITQKIFEIKNDACNFSYRDSIFKHDEGKHLIITHVEFLLHKNEQRKISYKDLVTFFSENTAPSVSEIRDAVINIRKNKFPDWHVVGTAGSFFKNPTISKEVYMKLCLQYPDIPGYSTENGEVKISLGWVLEHVCKLKGYTEGHVGLFEKQALVLIAERGATAEEIKNFSEKIIARVYDATHIEVEREVTLIK